jgi:hypothetical protein
MTMDKNAFKIRRAARERGITALYHFTPWPNVRSILERGLASREVLDAHGIFYVPTDDRRGDRRPGALSLSVQSINEAMLVSKLRKSRHHWAIFEIVPSVLWTHHCRFCWSNAASAPIRDHTGFLGGPWGFDRMFKDCDVSTSDARSLRETFGIPPYLPTLEDAEVQVFTPIAPDLIIDVTVTSDRDRRDLEAWMEVNGCVKPVEVCPDILELR